MTSLWKKMTVIEPILPFMQMPYKYVVFFFFLERNVTHIIIHQVKDQVLVGRDTDLPPSPSNRGGPNWMNNPTTQKRSTRDTNVINPPIAESPTAHRRLVSSIGVASRWRASAVPPARRRHRWLAVISVLFLSFRFIARNRRSVGLQRGSGEGEVQV